MTISDSICLGLDVAKDSLELATWPAQSHQTFANEGKGHCAVLEQVKGLRGAVVVYEATGAYEMAVAYAPKAAGLAALNLSEARDFARSMGKLTNPDRTDEPEVAHLAKLLSVRDDLHRIVRPLPDAR